ncbi:MAG: NAD(P)-binding protein [Streptosporangiales bacterium]|nr:NAD(P)-binding protein [Streptosporangiales bacterium]
MGGTSGTIPAGAPRVAIVGGGIGGLAAALCLRTAGIDATVYEQADGIVAAGAGTTVTPNAVRLLRRMGLAEEFERRAVRLEQGWEMRRWETGEVLFVQEMGERCREMYGEPCYTAHRGDLLGVLAGAVPSETLRLGATVTEVADESDRVRLTVQTRAGTETVIADAVIAADGMRSTLRETVVAAADPEFSGDSAFRCLIPAEKVPAFARRPVQTLWLGPGRHFVHYPVSAGRLINIVAIVPAGEWREESWIADGRVADLVAEFDGWSPRLGELIGAVTAVKRWALYDRRPLPRWTRGRFTLLGDAAHPMLPYYGQGANQAIEDAAVLALCLRDVAPGDLPAALLRYEEIRRPRASRVQEMSHGKREVNHMPDGPAQRARDAGFAGRSPLAANAWVYGHDAEAEAHGFLAGQPA